MTNAIAPSAAVAPVAGSVALNTPKSSEPLPAPEHRGYGPFNPARVMYPSMGESIESISPEEAMGLETMEEAGLSLAEAQSIGISPATVGDGGTTDGETLARGGPVRMAADKRVKYPRIAAQPDMNRAMAAHLASQGRGRDRTLVHMTPREVQGLGSLHPSGRMPINPNTGLPEADFLDFLPGILGTIAGTAFGMPWLGAAISGLGTWAVSGNLGKGILSGLLSYGLGSLGESLGAAGEEASKAAGKGIIDPVAKSATDLTPLSAATKSVDPVPIAGTGPGASTPPGLTPSSATIAPAVTPASGVPTILDKVGQNFANLPQKIGNVGTGIMNPQLWPVKEMAMPALTVASSAYGLNQMENKPPPPPAPMPPQQYATPQITDPRNPPRIPTEVVPSAGYATSVSPAEATFFKPNQAWGGYPLYANRGGPVTAYAAAGGVMRDGASYELARGGLSGLPSGLIRGRGGGMDDEIKGTIDGRKDVYLSDGEYVIDAQTVSALGDGSTESGARRLKQFVEDIRQGKFGSKKQPAKMANIGGLASLRMGGGGAVAAYGDVADYKKEVDDKNQVENLIDEMN